MKVLSVAYPLVEVSRDAAGGSEQVLALLCAGLVSRGHQSIVIAAKGSKVAGTLVESAPVRKSWTESQRRPARALHARLIRDVIQRERPDLVHFHGLDFPHYVPKMHVPVLATLHLPPHWYPRSLFERTRRDFYLNCVSRSEQATCPRSRLLVPCISNGIPIQSFEWRKPREDYVLSLGRICPEKAFHRALDAARLAKAEMVLAGEVGPYDLHRAYMAGKIKPLLDRRRRFIGPVGFEQKRDLLSRARCLLISSSVAETSSLVGMEALASGTPVIAFRAGALPEIIEHGRTGFIVDNEKEMADAIRAVGKISRAECRRVAEERFSAEMMVRRYLGLYRRVLAKSQYRNA